MEEIDKAEALLADLAEIMPFANKDSSEREKQARQIQYMEQRLYFLFMSGQRELAIQVANNLLEYPYRKGEIIINSVQYIRDHCACEDELYASADKHKLWESLWY